MIYSYIAAFFISLTGCLALTPVVKRIAVKIGAVDQPNERKVHKGSIPRLGGLSIFASAVLTMVLLVVTNDSYIASSWISSKTGIGLAGGVLGIVLLGMWDDIHNLKPSYKFVGQIVVSTIVYLAGVKISAISNPFDQTIIALGWLSYPITILWITGVTNAFNLIDGLDGLASGVALIALAAIIPIAVLRNDLSTVLLSVVYAGAIVGFLRYNFHPAKIFLGDSGSMMLGFVLAILSIQSSTKGSAVVAIVVPLLALGFPIMETLLSMARRYFRSLLPESDGPTSFFAKIRSMFLPDRSHIHHRLLDQGFTHRAAVLALYFISCILAAAAFLVTVSDDATTFVILLTVAVALYIGMKSLRYREMSILHNGVLLPLYDRAVLNRESFQVFMDIAFILAAFGVASLMTGGPQTQSPRAFVWPATVAVGIQLGVFWSLGLYRRGVRIVGINDILDIVKVAMVAESMTLLIFVLFSAQLGSVPLAAYILHFFFLLSLVLGSRCSHLILQHLFRQEIKTGRKVLIYGANAEGLWMLERILQLNFVGIAPMGFVDDDPSIVGKRLNGYPVYSGNGQLTQIAKDGKIDEIVVCADKIESDTLMQLQELAEANKIVLTRARIKFEEIKKERPVAKGGEAAVFQMVTQPVYPAGEEKVRSIPQVISRATRER